MESEIIFMTMMIVLFVFVGVVVVSMVVYDYNHPCIEYENYCVNHRHYFVMIGKVMTPQVSHYEVDCTSNYDEVQQRCIKRKGE
jgi:hypothetical protein